MLIKELPHQFKAVNNGLSRLQGKKHHTCSLNEQNHKYLLLAELEVRTVTYELSFSLLIYNPIAKHADHKSTRISNIKYGLRKRG